MTSAVHALDDSVAVDADRVLHCDHDPGAWLEARKLGIGSSDAPAILGLVSWSNPLLVYAEKTGMKAEEEASEFLRWGRVMEPVILREYARESDRDLPCKVDGWLYRSKLEPHRQATIDGWVGRWIAEVKTAPHTSHKWDQGVPEHVFAQVQHQLLVVGHDVAYVIALLGGYKLRWSVVERDQRFIDEILKPAEDALWERVQQRRPPGPDASDATRRALAIMYPKETGATIKLPGEFVALDQERVIVAAQMAALKMRKEEIDNAIKFAIGNASEGELENGASYTYRTTDRKQYTVKAISYRALRRSGSED